MSVDVSVCMVTYNHAKTIVQAIESVLEQETGYSYELVIGEDRSTDGTRHIVQAYARRYPGKIRPQLRETNLGMHGNYAQTLAACQGRYIAFLEGDDYWTDALKLQKQIECLETHPEFSACFSRTAVYVGEEQQLSYFIPPDNPHRRTYTIEDLLKRNPIATCSMVIRNVIDEIDLSPFRALPMIDWPLHVMVSLRGPIGYLNEPMAAYRLSGEGTWSSKEEPGRLEGMILAYRKMEEMLPLDYRPLLVRGVVRNYQKIARYHLEHGRYRLARGYIWKSCRAISASRILALRWYLKRAALLLAWSFRLFPRWSQSALDR